MLPHVFVLLSSYVGKRLFTNTRRFKGYCQKIYESVLKGWPQRELLDQHTLSLWSYNITDTSLKEAYDYLDYPYEHMVGSVFLLHCDGCERCYIGSSIFCPRCSKDGDPVRLMRSCQAKKCWANNKYYEEHKAEFTVLGDIYNVCPHTRCKADDGIRIHSVLECVLSIAFSEYFPILVDTSRTELSLHLNHCRNTEQLYWGYSYAMASILYHMGEFSLGSIIHEGLKTIPSVHKNGFTFNPDFESYFEPYEYELKYRRCEPEIITRNQENDAPDLQYVDKDDTIRNARKGLFKSELNMAAPHGLVLDALNTICEEEKRKKGTNSRTSRSINPPYDSGDKYDGPFFFDDKHGESQMDRLLDSVYKKTKDYYDSLPLSDSSPLSSQKKGKDVQFSFQHPGENVEVEDAFLFFSLHADGKPATPFGKSSDYNVVLLRVLNANGSVINSPAFTHSICVLPKDGKRSKRRRSTPSSPGCTTSCNVENQEQPGQSSECGNPDPQSEDDYASDDSDDSDSSTAEATNSMAGDKTASGNGAMEIETDANRAGGGEMEIENQTENNGEGSSTSKPSTESDDVYPWMKNLSEIVQAILYDANILGINGIYIRRHDPKSPKRMKWYHLRWSVVHFSADTVAEEEIIGYSGKKSSSFPCIYDLLCKNDIYSPDRMAYRDKKIKGSNKRDLSCPLHALRSFPVTSALAHLGFVAGLPSDMDLSTVAAQYPFLSNFQVEAEQIQYFFHHFFTNGTFIWTPTTPHHPALRQLLDVTLINQYSSSLKGRNTKTDTDLKFHTITETVSKKSKKKLAIVNTVVSSMGSNSCNEDDSGQSLTQFADSISGYDPGIQSSYSTLYLPINIRFGCTQYIDNFASISNDQVLLLNHPCIGSCGGNNTKVVKCMGSPDVLDLRKQVVTISHSMFTPWDCFLSMDDMHMGSNLIHRCQELLTGQRSDSQHIKSFADSVASIYGLNPDDVITRVPNVSNEELCNRLREYYRIVNTEILGRIAANKGQIKSFPIHDKTIYGYCYMEDIFQEDRFNNIVVFAILEIINLFGVLASFHMGWKKLANIGSLLLFYLSCLEGKQIPSATCPSFHRCVHIPDKILQNGPLFYSTNYYCEQYYGIVAKNLKPSADAITTCIKKLSLLSSSTLFLGPDYSVHLAHCKVNGQFVGSIKPIIHDRRKVIERITRANVNDDYGFARYLFLNRKTCLDQISITLSASIEDARQETADLVSFCELITQVVENYQSNHQPNDYKPEITFQGEFNAYLKCLWRDGRNYVACDPLADGLEFLSCEYINSHSNCLAYMTNYDGDLEVYLICGFFICEVRTVPYVQAFCIRLPVQSDNPYISSPQRRILLGSSLQRMNIRNGCFWRLISLYRLHLMETKTILVTSDLLKLRMESLHIFQCNAISCASELLPDGKGNGMFDVIFDRNCAAVGDNPIENAELEDAYAYTTTYDFTKRLPKNKKK